MIQRLFFLTTCAILAWTATAKTVESTHAFGVELGRPITVMTRNLYVGADLFEVLKAERPEQIPLLVAKTFHDIVNSSFEFRAQALASEIKQFQPDIVALQEVSLIRLQSPGDFMIGNPASAKIIIYDYLALLQKALNQQGLDYEVAGEVQNADIELPMFAGGDASGPRIDDIRLTDRDVVLVKKGVRTAHVNAVNFKTNLTIPIAGTSVEFTRGYVSLYATVNNRTYRIINAHLEVGGNAPFTVIQAAQMNELLTSLKGESLPLIVLGDFNSSPDDALTQPYHLAANEGWVDMWSRTHPFSKGFTCCQNPLLRNTKSELNQKIDHIFVLNNLGGRLPFSMVGLAKVKVTGNQPADMILGMWPSDHAGVVARLNLPFIRQ